MLKKKVTVEILIVKERNQALAAYQRLRESPGGPACIGVDCEGTSRVLLPGFLKGKDPLEKCPKLLICGNSESIKMVNIRPLEECRLLTHCKF